MLVIDSGALSAKRQMQIDEELLENVDRPILRFYDWTDGAVTYGYFINPASWLKEVPENCGRRPTGGGLIFHEADFSFTLALPGSHPLVQLPVLDRYQIINKQVLKSIEELLPDLEVTLNTADPKVETLAQLCMANPTPFDLLFHNKKVGGAAQRKKKSGFIHQSSLFLLDPSWEKISELLLDPDYVMPKIKACTGALFSKTLPIILDSASRTGESKIIDFKNGLKRVLEGNFKKIINFH